MLINFVDATNDANHYTKPPPNVHHTFNAVKNEGIWPIWLPLNTKLATATTTTTTIAA